ncbi:oxidoreductase, FAD-binding [Aspergillus luchuensis]|uniref:Oxidoreductase, FAD-binding n=1 Tax=Aspergillus kawachii TaxID=1069201 RepID=A0A146EZT6_ASPKA|nr:oxidoreductase, FAD-binding [Aspergillus luchuensis]
MSYQEHVWPRTAAAEASSYPPLNKQSLDRLGYEDTIVIYLSTASPGNYITSAAYDSPRASTQYRGHAVLRNELDRRLETLSSDEQLNGVATRNRQLSAAANIISKTSAMDLKAAVYAKF